ncbi:helix-turn-helix transcriptional regulator, partial [Mycobacterium sp. ITM-2017-0098]
IHVLVRRASLSLDSDLLPDADLLTSAAHGAVWLANLSLAERLADAASRSGATPESDFVRAHALSWLGRGREADAVLAAIDASRLSDGERARLAFLRASNMLWALGDPANAKHIIDDAASTTEPQSRSYIDAFLTVYWFAMDRPDAAVAAAEGLEFDQMPSVVGAELAWVLTTIDADAGRAAAAVENAEAGYLAATR